MQHSEECMCRLRNIAMCDYQESVTTGQTHRQTPDKVIPMCRYAATQASVLWYVSTYVCLLCKSQLHIW